MTDPRLLKRVKLTSAHQRTGKTQHFHANRPIPEPVELRIVQYSSDPGFYLFYCDESGSEMTDTYHDSIQEAMAQANWEFQVKERDWKDIGNDSE